MHTSKSDSENIVFRFHLNFNSIQRDKDNEYESIQVKM